MDEDDYKVGYRRPPKASRFQKGQSGNPKGRPKGTRNFKTDFLEVINQRILVREPGKPPRKITKQRGTVLRLIEGSLKGEKSALALALPLMERYSSGEDTPQATAHLSAKDQEIVEAFLKKRTTNQGGGGSDDTQ
jgi:hypothetical protein